MATHTTNYNLSKPEASDAFSAFRQSYNDNMDIIDANLGGGGGGGTVTDVRVNGTSVVVGGIANVPVPTETSDLTNDSDFVSDASYVHTDNNFTTAEKTKLSGIEDGAEVNVQSDWNEADSTADDFIKNKPSIPSATSDLVNDSGFLTSSDVSAVALSGDYDDLTDKPSIPSNTSDLTNDSGFITASALPTKLSDLTNDEGFTAVGYTQVVLSGTKIGEIDIDGNTTDIYAPSGGSGDSVSWNQIQVSGTKIAEIDINGTVTDVYAPSGAPAFSALIIVTADTGQTVTASKGGDTYTATEVTSGTYEVTVDSLGIWTISDGTLSDTVTITAQGVYYVTLSAVPDGKTVTPTDDIQIWLNCADIWDKTYTTLSEVLADSTTLSALMADNNAVDYLVRSTTWASDITADSSAMSYIGLNNYASNTLLADSTWCSAICNSTYFESVLNVKIATATGYTVANGVCSASSERTNYYAWYAIDGTNIESHLWTPSNQTGDSWWQFKFNSPVNIKKVTSNQYKRDSGSWAISYSADGVDFTNKIAQGVFTETVIDVDINADTHINTNAEYFRWEYTNMPARPVINRTQFYGRADV